MEQDFLRKQALESGKPENIVDTMVKGRMNKFFAENCLNEQAYVKDDKITVQELISQTISKLRENITVGRFARFKVGEE